MKKMKRCTNCLMPETRPRLWFDEEGICSACLWAKEKQTINWQERWECLEKLCAESKREEGRYDCIVPVSGGKDSSYVAYMLKHKFKMNPLCVTVTPGIPAVLGQQNLRNFINSGYDLLQIDINPKVLAQIDRVGLIDHGRPMLGWMTAVQTAIFKLAVQLQIPFVMFGEEGELEYGGSAKLKNTPYYDVEDSINLYLSGSNPLQYRDILSKQELNWFEFPSKEELIKLGLKMAKFSYFENWDPYHHYLIAKEFCGLQESKQRIEGTYNNFAQTDTILYNLHACLMYLKFGFGRCTQDVGIDIRRGALTRKQGLSLVKKYDHEFPEQYIQEYCNYYKMDVDEFNLIIAKHVNKDLFDFSDGKWVPNFEIV